MTAAPAPSYRPRTMAYADDLRHRVALATSIISQLSQDLAAPVTFFNDDGQFKEMTITPNMSVHDVFDALIDAVTP